MPISRNAVSRGLACAAGVLLPGFTAASSQQPAIGAEGPARQVDGETLGFVMTQFNYVTTEKPDCPDGLNKSLAEILAENDPKPAPGAVQVAQAAAGGQAAQGNLLAQAGRTRRGIVFTEGKLKGQQICLHPTEMQVPPHKTVRGSQAVLGLDLDGQGTLTKTKGGSCAHDNFTGPDGRATIDNQVYRLNGCSRTHMAGGTTPTNFRLDLTGGAWSVVMEIHGVNDRRNDPEVEVALYGSADPTPFSAGGKPLPFGSLTVRQEPKFRTRVKGRIVNGVLTTDPTEISFYTPSTNIKREQLFREARLQLTLKPDGSAEGVLGGYRPIQDYYFNMIAMRNYPAYADLAADAGGYTCSGMYQALQQNADGLMNPQTGKCEGISMAFGVKAHPAFVITEKGVQASAR